jgi:hypothetical protein
VLLMHPWQPTNWGVGTQLCAAVCLLRVFHVPCSIHPLALMLLCQPALLPLLLAL